MDNRIQELILKATKSTHVKGVESVQTLWSGYGEILRVSLNNGRTVIVKHIKPPNEAMHPRGWNTSNSHQRKLKSYQVEQNWYAKYGNRNQIRIPKLIYSETFEEEQILILEDLDAAGFNKRKSRLTFNEVKLCLSWLAEFHAVFMNEESIGLWKTGTYWHLATRPDELKAMNDGRLKDAAALLDTALNSCKYQTLVHGDAKVANFCFTPNMDNVAAVDFQYVGGGCGMKDVAYLFSSCLDEEECELYAESLLNFYFDELENQLNKKDITVAFDQLELEWREMYSVAWADFTRFLMGWMPTHQKLNKYSARITEEAMANT